MGIKSIEKRSFLYSFLKLFVDYWHNKVFYREVILLHKENIPEDGPMIFTPNHQNALMDALALLCNTDKRMVFMARSDIFQNPVIASVLYFLRILPIYRIRDGYDTLKKNKRIFSKTMDVLNEERCALVILPEGNHEGIRRLRTLKKGFARIAFQMAEAQNFSPDLKIVPVGIDYDVYETFDSRLVVNFGKPIHANKYYALYQEAPAKALNQLKDELSDHIKPLIIHIETKTYYDLVNTLRNLYGVVLLEGLTVSDRRKKLLPVQQQIVAGLQEAIGNTPEKIQVLDRKVQEYLKVLKKLKIRSTYKIKSVSLKEMTFQAVKLLLFFPLYLYGLINHIIPFSISVWARNKINDTQFKSSFLFTVSLLAFPLFLILQTILFSVFVPVWYGVVAYFVSVPLSGRLLLFYRKWAEKFFMNRKIYHLFRNRRDLMEQLHQDYQDIIKLTSSLIRTDIAETGRN